jgi:hypothetical protein
MRSWEDDDNNNNAGMIWPHLPSTTGGIGGSGGGGGGWRETDKEENALLLDKMRIWMHPDLRFFLKLRKDLGQKRYTLLRWKTVCLGKAEQGGEFLLLHVFFCRSPPSLHLPLLGVIWGNAG